MCDLSVRGLLLRARDMSHTCPPLADLALHQTLLALELPLAIIQTTTSDSHTLQYIHLYTNSFPDLSKICADSIT